MKVGVLKPSWKSVSGVHVLENWKTLEVFILIDLEYRGYKALTHREPGQWLLPKNI